MSDENNNPLQPTDGQNMRKTSAVPLRKETVRVTLKSAPGGPGQPAPTAPMTAAPDAPPIPNSASGIPDVTAAVPLKQQTMRVTLKADGAPKAPQAPSIASAPATTPIGTGSLSPKIPAPAPTVPLNTGGSALPPQPLATQPLGGQVSQPLPKATVQLQQTQQLQPPVGGVQQAPAIHTAVDDEEEEEGSNLHMILAIVACVLAAFLLFAQFQRASIWIDAHKKGEYGELF